MPVPRLLLCFYPPRHNNTPHGHSQTDSFWNMLYTALMRRFPRIYDNRQLYTAAGKQLHKRADGQALTAADMMAKP
jgi:hypothetical protein